MVSLATSPSERKASPGCAGTAGPGAPGRVRGPRAQPPRSPGAAGFPQQEGAAEISPPVFFVQ